MKALQREIFISFWKIHILHHAAEGPIIGQWMLRELQQHGYDVSPGTLYPILHRMHALGWLSCTVDESRGLRAPKYYSITPDGLAALKLIHKQLGELKREVIPAARPGTQ